MASICSSDDCICVTLNKTTFVSEYNEKVSVICCPPVQEDGSEIGVPFACCDVNSKYFVCCCQKTLSLWSRPNWSLVSSRTLARGASKVRFTPSGSYVVVADKTGDVYNFSVQEPEQNGQLLLGHLSMILDVLVTPDEQFIITCDRDEKIRVSHYPNSYNIHCYCLGHEEFVTAIQLLPMNILMSGSGDGTLRFWDFTCGKQLYCYKLLDGLSQFTPSPPSEAAVTSFDASSLPNNLNLACVALSQVNGVLIFKITTFKDVSCDLIQLINTPCTPWTVNLNQNHQLSVLFQNDSVFKAFDFVLDDFKFTSHSKLWVPELNSRIQQEKLVIDDFKNCQTFVSFLYKKKYDNVQEYLKRKNERIELESCPDKKKRSFKS